MKLTRKIKKVQDDLKAKVEAEYRYAVPVSVREEPVYTCTRYAPNLRKYLKIVHDRVYKQVTHKGCKLKGRSSLLQLSLPN